MTTYTTAFNLFANAFVRAKGMPFPVAIQTKPAVHSIHPERMAADAGQFWMSSLRIMRGWQNDLD